MELVFKLLNKNIMVTEMPKMGELPKKSMGKPFYKSVKSKRKN